jgi:hypothetical protein
MTGIAWPRQRHVELALDHGMDEVANPTAQGGTAADAGTAGDEALVRLRGLLQARAQPVV